MVILLLMGLFMISTMGVYQSWWLFVLNHYLRDTIFSFLVHNLWTNLSKGVPGWWVPLQPYQDGHDVHRGTHASFLFGGTNSIYGSIPGPLGGTFNLWWILAISRYSTIHVKSSWQALSWASKYVWYNRWLIRWVTCTSFKRRAWTYKNIASITCLVLSSHISRGQSPCLIKKYRIIVGQHFYQKLASPWSYKDNAKHCQRLTAGPKLLTVIAGCCQTSAISGCWNMGPSHRHQSP